ncbi:MAG TPA: RsmB/NOP family class I SAM-dependent RNA methyltransferase [Desulfobacteraceae bacterium]|nr:RsmB/NOP family class I SAM-dependent RNA methyltransferase [Desulfobacteraceae bacterium]
MTFLFEEYGDIIPDFSAFQESLGKPLPTHIRINRLRVEPATLIRLLEEKGICLTRASQRYDTLCLAPGLSSPGNLLEYFLGYIHPQALTSAMAALVLSPAENCSLLDMCAAPGGKSSHCADLMNNTGLIISNDLYTNRHPALGHTLARMGVLNAVVTAYQAQEFPLKHRFDFVLADVPCSCEGKFRKTETASRYREVRGKETLPDLQKKILFRGFDLLKENGRLLYSTCTYNPRENESVVDRLLNERDAELFPIDIGIDLDAGLTEWNGETYDKRLGKALRFYPHRIDSVGFFMAGIGRRS